MIRRKEHIEIAKIIRKYNIYQQHTGNMSLVEMVSEIANMLQRNNPSFDRSKFMKDCGWYNE